MTRYLIGLSAAAALVWGRLAALVLLAVALTLGVMPVGTASAQAQRDIVDTAVSAGQFTTLARALQAAGLVDTLKGPGPFTVFAPTDAAFSRLPAGTLDALLANPAQLRAVLTYHVVPGRVTAAQVTGLSSAATVQGEPLRITTSGGAVRINNATVTQADVMASNGVIHVVDTVLLPPSLATLPRTGAAPTPVIPLAAGITALLAGVWLTSRRVRARGMA